MRLLTVEERIPAKVACVAEAGTVVLPYLHLVPLLPGESGVPCGRRSVELRRLDGSAEIIAAEIVDTVLPFHVRCRVVVLDVNEDDVPVGAEVWDPA